jgi:haloalkane dehalogenase
MKPSIVSRLVSRLGCCLVLGAGLALPLAAQTPESLPPVPPADFPFESHFVEVLGSKIHYVDEGEGQVFVFLHGNPTSSYLWRNVIPHVTRVGRAIAMDLIGFGKSDKPELAYTLQDHARYVDGFIAALDLDNIVLVVHDWGSVLGLDYARRNEKNVRGVAFMEAIIPPTFPMPSIESMGPGGGLFAQFRTPEAGKKLLIEQNVFIEQIVGSATVTRKMSEAEMEAYRAPFVDPASRFPIYVWPNELPIGGEPARNVEAVNRVGEWLKTSDLPKLLLYARPGAIVSPESAEWMAANYRNIETRFVGYGRHYIQEDVPEAIGRSIADWFGQLDR